MALRKKKEEERTGELAFQVLFRESALGISFVDLERCIVDVNPAFEKLLGYSRTELLGRTFAGLLYPEDSAKNLELHRQLLAGEREVYHMTRRYVHKDGRLLWTRLMVSLLRNASGEAYLTMGIVEDITETKVFEAKVAELATVLAHAAKLSAMGQMASGIAHEIANPLNVIQFRARAVKLAAREEGLPPQVAAKLQEAAANIEKNIERIVHIISNVKGLAHKSEGEALQTVALTQLVHDTVDLCLDRYQRHGVTLKIKDVPPDAKLRCRPTQLLQVLVNLLNNAFDAVQRLPERWTELEVRVSAQNVELRVTDSGKGIEEAVVQKLFTPFFTTKPLGEGTGLGLGIAREIVQSHGGTLAVDRTCPNTCFVIRLPRER